MQLVIIGVTFFLGVALMLCAIVAIFKGLKPGQGTFKFAGLEISGTGAIVLVFVALAMVLSGFGWASSQKKVVICQSEKKEVAATAGQLSSQLQREVQLRQELIRQLPPATKQQIEVQRPDLMKFSRLEISPRVREEILRVHPNP